MTGINRLERIGTILFITLPPEIEERLDAIVESTDRSKASLVCEAIIEGLSELEDLQVTAQHLRDNEAGRSRTYALEEVERELGLAD